jgi:hypothetical protein
LATATRTARSTRSTKIAAAAEAAKVEATEAQTEVAAAETAVVETKKFPKADVAAKAPTDLHKNMAKWLEETTGYAPDLKTVQLVCSMRMEFQASEANQSDLAQRRAAAIAKQEARVAKAKEAAAKAVARAEKLAKAAKAAK